MEHQSKNVSTADLLGLVYEAALNRDARALLASLREQLGADCLHRVERELPGGEVRSAQGADPPDAVLQAFHREYQDYWCAADPLVKSAMACGAAAVWRCQDLPDSSDAVAYRQFLARHGLRWAMAGLYRPDPACVTLLVAHASAQRGPFGEGAAALLSELLPHCTRAAAVAHTAQRRRASGDLAASILRQLPTPYVLTDELGRCVDANDAFHHSAQRLGLRVVMGRLRFRKPEHQQVLERALHETCLTGVEHTLKPGALPGLPCSITFTPWREEDGAGDSDHRLMLATVEEHPVAAELPEAQRVLDARLTRAELEVLASLLQGLPAKTIALHRGASVNTVRSQIGSILDKTGYRSQRQLIASFGGSVACGFVESAFGMSVPNGIHPS